MGIAVPLIFICGAVFLYIVKQGPPCIFYKLTGLYCPGCGSGRATVALLHGDIVKAFGHNMLYVLLLPIIAYYVIKEYAAYVLDKDILPFFEVNLPIAITLTVVILVFWILRNIPVYPFTLLAP